MLVRALRLGPGGKELGQGVGTDVLGTGTERQGEIKSAEEEGPARLPGTEPLRVADVDQVLMVRPDEDRMLGLHVDGQKFPVPHVIMMLRQSEASGQQGGRVDELVPPPSVETGQLRCPHPMHPPPR